MPSGLGAFGESWAVAYLARRGYRILDRNVRFRRGEIDIVASEGGELVFVEVKTRRSSVYGRPEESITRRRYEHLAAAVAEYVARSETAVGEFRVDVVAIEVDATGRVARCELFKAVQCPE